MLDLRETEINVLMQTIRLPKNLQNLAETLPFPKYEDDGSYTFNEDERVESTNMSANRNKGKTSGRRAGGQDEDN